MKYALAVVVFTICEGNIAHAGDCAKTLVPTTIKSDTVSISDVFLARTVSKDQYDTMRKNLSGDAVIYSIPVGFNYSEYQNNISTYAEALTFKNYEKYASTYEETGLSGINAKIYHDCMRQHGIAISLQEITPFSYTVSIDYQPGTDTDFKNRLQSRLSNPRNIDKQSLDALTKLIATHRFPNTLQADMILYPADPREQTSFAIMVGGGGSSISLPPLSVPLLKTAVAQSEVGRIQAGIPVNKRCDPKDLCVTPKHPGGKLLKPDDPPSGSTKNFLVQENPLNDGAAKITIKEANQVCVRMNVCNTSDLRSGPGSVSTFSGRLNVQEVYPEMPELKQKR